MADEPRSTLRSFVVAGTTARNVVITGAQLQGVQLSGLRADGLDYARVTCATAA